jgi:hypothetical protein
MTFTEGLESNFQINDTIFYFNNGIVSPFSIEQSLVTYNTITQKMAGYINDGNAALVNGINGTGFYIGALDNEIRIGYNESGQYTHGLQITNSTSILKGKAGQDVIAFTDINYDPLVSIKESGDVELHQSNGIILKSQNGTRYKIVVADDGTLSTIAV